MPTIEGIRIQNFRSLKDVRLGRVYPRSKTDSLTPLTVVIGKNGVGKSSLFDAFGFLADALKFGVEEACDMRGRGGFFRLRSFKVDEPIIFNISFITEQKATPIYYHLKIDIDDSDRPFIDLEVLHQSPPSKKKQGGSNIFLALSHGAGCAWKGETKGGHIDKGFNTEEIIKLTENPLSRQINAEAIEIADNRKLGIATLGALKDHPRISAFRQFIEDWHLSYFTPDAARGLPLAGPQKHLNKHGDNLGNVVQFMEREHPDRFQSILDKIAAKIPGIGKISTVKTQDGRLLLQFNDKGFQDPFYAQQMSDGTLKLFAYLLLLEDPTPPSFICIEEPENGLYHKLLETLVAEFRERATGKEGGTQVFVTTHQPYLVDALDPKEVWILDKGEDGFSTIKRASDDPLVQNLVDEGLPLGGLWYSDYLDAR
jgi:predicted ATPase